MNNTKGLEGLLKEYDRVLFLDCETTGFDPSGDDQMIELAVIAIDEDGTRQDLDEFIYLFKMTELPEKIVKLTGITDWMLGTQGKEEEEVLQKFVGLITDWTILVAHNAPFDLAFIAKAIQRNMPAHPGWMTAFNKADYLDSLTIFRDRRPQPHKLKDAIQVYGLKDKVQNSHRAIDDTQALMEVVKAMGSEKDDLAQYANLFGVDARHGEDKIRFKKVEYKSQQVVFGRIPEKPLWRKGGDA